MAHDMALVSADHCVACMYNYSLDHLIVSESRKQCICSVFVGLALCAVHAPFCVFIVSRSGFGLNGFGFLTGLLTAL